ncbi:thiocillin family RiPP [Actinomyces israelii]
MDNDIDLTGDDVEVETLADGSALGCFACATSGSTA